jgi:hypothetical protein
MGIPPLTGKLLTLLVVFGLAAAGALAWVSLGSSSVAVASCDSSSPAILQADFRFTERSTAGVLSASVDLPAGARLWGILFENQSEWQANGSGNGTFNLQVSDEQGVVGEFNEQAAETDHSMEFWDPENVLQTGHIATATTGLLYPNGQTITVSITTTLDSSPVEPTGVMLVKLFYLPTGPVVDAGFH